MSEEWANMALGELLTLEYGKALPERNRDGVGSPVLGSNGVVGYHSVASVPGPGIVVGRKGTAGSVTWVPSDFSPIDTTYWVKLLGEQMSMDFAYLLLLHSDLPSICAQTGVPGLNRDRAYEIVVHLPPPVVQRRIVDLMAHLDTHITNLRAERDSAEELLFGTRDEILKVQDGWNQTSLGDICTKIGSGATPRGGESSYRPDGVSLIRSQNVYDLRFEMQGLAHIGPNQARLLEGVTVEDGDILLNITGASVNRCCVVPTQVLPARVNQHVAIIRARREKVRSDFLVHLLRRRDNLRLLDRMAGAGTTRQALTKKQIEEFEVSLPDLSEQARLAGILDALRATVASLQVEVEAQSAARTVLLSALMSGDVILPNDYDSLLSQVA